jgi:hypothetical protein
VVRCTIPERADKRLVVAYLPRQSARLQRGQQVWLVCDTRKAGPAIAAAWLE